MTRDLEEGIRLFNAGRFFEAHEALENVWLGARGEERTFLHGLIQIAAAFHHYTRQNETGFRSLLEKGWTKLDNLGRARGGIDLAHLRQQLEPWFGLLAGGFREDRTPPPLPRIACPADH